MASRPKAPFCLKPRAWRKHHARHPKCKESFLPAQTIPLLSCAATGTAHVADIGQEYPASPIASSLTHTSTLPSLSRHFSQSGITRPSIRQYAGL